MEIKVKGGIEAIESKDVKGLNGKPAPENLIVAWEGALRTAKTAEGKGEEGSEFKLKIFLYCLKTTRKPLGALFPTAQLEKFKKVA